jgi:hypothetical protein
MEDAMKIVRLIPILCLLVLASGCLMSEQIGGPSVKVAQLGLTTT